MGWTYLWFLWQTNSFCVWFRRNWTDSFLFFGIGTSKNGMGQRHAWPNYQMRHAYTPHLEEYSLMRCPWLWLDLKPNTTTTGHPVLSNLIFPTKHYWTSSQAIGSRISMDKARTSRRQPVDYNYKDEEDHTGIEHCNAQMRGQLAGEFHSPNTPRTSSFISEPFHG